MGTSNFGTKFLKDIQLIYRSSKYDEIEENNEINEDDLIFDDVIKPFIEKQNQKLDYLKISFEYGYYDGVQLTLEIDYDALTYPSDETQEEFDKTFKKDLEVIKDTIEHASKNELEIVNIYSPWLAPAPLEAKSEELNKLLKSNLISLSSEMYHFIEPDGVKNHSKKIVQEIFPENIKQR